MNKYGARKVQGYASAKEARRARELQLLQQAGKISGLQEQVKFVLVPAQKETITETVIKRGMPVERTRTVVVERELAYISDFVYKDESSGETIVEDVKGYKDPSSSAYRIFVIKRKLMRWLHGIKIREV